MMRMKWNHMQARGWHGRQELIDKISHKMTFATGDGCGWLVPFMLRSGNGMSMSMSRCRRNQWSITCSTPPLTLSLFMLIG
ncbi:hypothetical protein V6N13_112070 [Hibiscus sabdariffa]